MKLDPLRHHRRSIRLPGYDCSQAGAYFVTVCTHGRALHFANMTIRAIAEQCWSAIPRHFPEVELDEWVVMPNHLHGIVVMTCRGVQLNAPTRDAGNAFSVMSPHRKTLAVVIRTYKAFVTTACRRAGMADFGWQRNYFEHVIRNERELNLIQQYIIANPVQWDLDRENPLASGMWHGPPAHDHPDTSGCHMAVQPLSQAC